MKSILLSFFCLTSLLVNLTKAQDLPADLLKNNGSISARINQYDPNRYNYLIGRKSVELKSDHENLEFESSKWQITKQVKPLEKLGKYEIAIFFNCLSGNVDNASVSVDFNFKEWS